MYSSSFDGDRKKIHWQELWRHELEGMLPHRPVVLVPVGSIEQHGPHCPLDVDIAGPFLAAVSVATACLIPGSVARPLARLAEEGDVQRVEVEHPTGSFLVEVELDLGARMEPNHPLIKTFRAVVCNRRGETREALEIIREVLERHPRMDGIRPIYAHFLSRVGEHEAALAERAQHSSGPRDAPLSIHRPVLSSTCDAR